MTQIILAGALGAIALSVYLLFRQLRKLSWQLTQLRVERDSERILHAIGVRTYQTAVNGGEEGSADPARRKGHLTLYLGGGSLAALLLQLRDYLGAQRGALAVSSAVTAAAALAAGTIVVLPPSGSGPTPGDARSPSSGHPTSLESPSREPPAGPRSRRSPRADPPGEGPAILVETTTGRAGQTSRAPASSAPGSSAEGPGPQPSSSGADVPPPQPLPSASSSPTARPTHPGLRPCLTVAAPLLDVGVCLG